MSEQKSYYAFISYNREDKKEAKRLQHTLEYYKLPYQLRQEKPNLPEYVRPIFRDMTDLEVGELSKQIHEALDQSHYLIVICSPRSAKSKWVNDEIDYFISIGKQDKIIPYIIEGIPHAENPDEECYPPALLTLSKDKELLGANINEVGKDSAAIRVVSRMFDIRFDTLYQRYNREQKRKRVVSYSIILFVILFLSSIAGYVVYMNKTLDEKNRKMTENRDRMIVGESEVLIENGDILKAGRLLLYILHNNDEHKYSMVCGMESSIRNIYNQLIHAENPLVATLGSPFDGDSWTSHHNVAISPQGDVVAVFNSRSNEINLYNTLNGKRYRNIQIPISSGVSHCVYSSDGKMLAASSYNGYIFIWNVYSGEMIGQVIDEDGSIGELLWGENNRLITCDNFSNNCKIWDLNGALIDTLEFSSGALYGEISPTKKFLAVSTNAHVVELWNLDFKGRIFQFQHEHGGKKYFLYRPAFNKEETLLATCGDDSIVNVWDINSGDLTFSRKFNSYVVSTCFYNNYFLVYTGDFDVFLYDVNYNLVKSYTKSSIIFSPSGIPFVFSYSSSTINDIKSGIKYKIKGCSHASTMAIDNERNYFCAPTADGYVKLWKLKNIKAQFFQSHGPFRNFCMRSLTQNKKGDLLLAAYRDNNIRLWSYPEGELISIFSGHTGEIKSAVFNDAENSILSYAYDSTVILWNLNKVSNPIILKHNNINPSAYFINEDKQILSYTWDSVYIWDSSDGAKLKSMQIISNSAESDTSISDCVYDEESGKIIISLNNGNIQIWDVTKNICESSIKVHDDLKKIIQISACQFLSYSHDGTIKILDIQKECIIKEVNVNNAVYDLKIIPQSNDIVASLSNGNIIKWDCQRSMQVNNILANTASAERIDIRGKYLTTITGDNLLFIINLENSEIVAKCKVENFYLHLMFSNYDNNIIFATNDGRIVVTDFSPIDEIIGKLKIYLQDYSLDEEEKRQYYLEYK